MITPVVMPQLGLEVTEGTVVSVLCEPGARVGKDEPILELETDKATTDVVAPCDGVVRSVAVAVGDTVPVGATLALLADTEDEPLDAGVAGRESDRRGGASSADAVPRDAAPSSVPAANGNGAVAVADSARQRVAPVARRAACKLGVDLATLAGTGPRGRITLGDVEAAHASRAVAPAPIPAPPASAFAAAAPPSPPAAPVVDGDGRREQLGAIRRAIARRMSQSQLIPQFELARDVDVSHLAAQREAQLAGAGDGPRVGVNDLLIQALAETARRHPAIVASYREDDGGPHLLQPSRVDIGLAVAGDRGLVVPVIRDPGEAGLASIARQRSALVGAARAGRLGLAEMSGGAITLSSLASFGVDRFTAMLNPGESAIVAIGRTTERVVPHRRGTVVVPLMTVTVTFDHRAVDGSVGAAALRELAHLLEGAMAWRP